MKTLFAGRLAAAVACMGMIAQPGLAAQPIVTAPAVADIALADGGLFAGKVVNAQGVPIAKAPVVLHMGGEKVAAATTNEKGVFAVKGLRPGLCTVAADGGQVAYRLWAPNAAPPVANQSALIVTGEAVLNGQYPGHPGHPGAPSGHPGILGWMREHPLLVAAGVAAAIAIPIAVADDDDDPAS